MATDAWRPIVWDLPRGANCRATGRAARLHLLASMAFELAPHGHVERIEQLAPARVAELRGAPRRADDVDEQDRREDSIDRPCRDRSRQEFLGGIEQGVLVADPRDVV